MCTILCVNRLYVYVHQSRPCSMHTYVNRAACVFSDNICKNPQRDAQPPNLSPVTEPLPHDQSRPAESSLEERIRGSTRTKEVLACGRYRCNRGEYDSRRVLRYPGITGLVNINSTPCRFGQANCKPPKPLPYLEYISSYLSRDQLQNEKRSDQRRKTVTFAESLSRRVSASNKERLPELAYLIVDVQSGTISGENNAVCVRI